MLADTGGVQQPGIAEVGKRGGARTGVRRGVFVGNWDYKGVPWGDLPGAKRDVKSMQSKFSKYTGKLYENEPSTSLIGDAYNVASELNPGDELLYYYAGHGTPKGLVGVESKGPSDGILPNEAITGLVNHAEKKGFHLTAILDCCHSGGAAGDVRRDTAEDLAEDKNAPQEVRDLGNIAKAIERVRKRMANKDTKAIYGKEHEKTTGAGRGLLLGDKQVGAVERDPFYIKAHKALEYQRGKYRKTTNNGTELDDVLPALDDFLAYTKYKRVDIAAEMAGRVLKKVRGLDTSGAG
jgi:hypothetical protein